MPERIRRGARIASKDALADVGNHIADSTVANVLKAHGIEPAPDRQRSQSWSTFLKAHWDSLYATDFTTVEVWTTCGLVTSYILAVMHLKTRRVQIAGITPSPNAVWVRQVCRSLTDCEDGFLKDASQLIVDRDTCFLAMREYLSQNTDTEVVLLPPKSPNLNAYMERWFRSLKSECIDRMISFGKRSLERAVTEYVEHHHVERNHQGLENELIEPGETTGSENGTIDCREGLVDCSSTIIVKPPELRLAIAGSVESLSDPSHLPKTARSAWPRATQ